jgi:predicted transcriptional regulator
MNLRRSEKLPSKLRNIREMLELSEAELIESLGVEDWVKVADIVAFEAGKLDPPLPFLLVVANLANISTNMLIDDRRRLPKKLPAKQKL